MRSASVVRGARLGTPEPLRRVAVDFRWRMLDASWSRKLALVGEMPSQSPVAALLMPEVGDVGDVARSLSSLTVVLALGLDLDGVPCDSSIVLARIEVNAAYQ